MLVCKMIVKSHLKMVSLLHTFPKEYQMLTNNASGIVIPDPSPRADQLRAQVCRHLFNFSIHGIPELKKTSLV